MGSVLNLRRLQKPTHFKSYDWMEYYTFLAANGFLSNTSLPRLAIFILT